MIATPLWTDEIVQNFKFKEGNKRGYDIREKSGNGFGITIFPSGEKSFIYIYYFEGRKRRMTLGKYPQCSLEDARKLHKSYMHVLERGGDPAFQQKLKKKMVKEINKLKMARESMGDFPDLIKLVEKKICYIIDAYDLIPKTGHSYDYILKQRILSSPPYSPIPIPI